LSSGKIKKKDPLTKREREAIKEVEKVLGGKKEEIKDALSRLKTFSRKLQGDKQFTFFDSRITKFETNSEYLKT